MAGPVGPRWDRARRAGRGLRESLERRQVRIVAEETIPEAAWQGRWVLAVAELATQDTASQKSRWIAT